VTAPAGGAAPARPSPIRLPEWARKGDPLSPEARPLRVLLREQALHTVCEEARCPNLKECFSRGTATFMLLGDRCTRRCVYCSVETGKHFKGDARALRALLEARPDVFNHNIETVPRLFPTARAQGSYRLSLDVLRAVKTLRPEQVTKSGLMVGLGETDDEIDAVLADLRAHDVDIVTLGQYLRPTRLHLPVDRYVPPAGFEALADRARAMGFGSVYAGVFVRSSYNAEEIRDDLHSR
jgi:lipoyl synthase